MVTVKTSGKRRILDSILHPNREVQPQYMAYEILTSGDDEGLVGLIQDETATSLRLLQSGGVMHDIPRSRLVRMVPAGTSLMPEGLVSDLSVQQMADLLEYLVRVRQ
jgi:putative heme-binding domain-containing protein